MATTKLPRSLFISSLLSAFMLSAIGCAEEPQDDAPIELDDVAAARADLAEGGKEDKATIATTEFNDPNARFPPSTSSQVRRIFTSSASYRSYFGNNAPSTVNWSKDWVVFYSAGTQSSGGYDASILKVAPSNSGKTLKITTRLERPGSDCFVTLALTRPYVLAKFRRPSQTPTSVAYYKSDETYSCADPEPANCTTVLCTPGSRCVQTASGPSCVPIEEGGPANCTTVLCTPGSHCVQRPSGPACVPN